MPVAFIAVAYFSSTQTIAGVLHLKFTCAVDVSSIFTDVTAEATFLVSSLLFYVASVTFWRAK